MSTITAKGQPPEDVLDWQIQRRGLNTKRVHSVGHYVSKLSCRWTRKKKRVLSRATQSSSDVPVKESDSLSEDGHNSCSEQTSGSCASRPSGGLAAQRGLPVWVTQSRLFEEDVNTFSRCLFTHACGLTVMWSCPSDQCQMCPFRLLL